MKGLNLVIVLYPTFMANFATMLKHISFPTFFRIVQSSAAGGILLLLCVAVSLIIANTGLAKDFTILLNTSFGFEGTVVHLNYSVLTWINDGLMAVFFLLVGLEIKREVAGGELSSVRRAALPVLAAMGGAIVPAIIYWAFNANAPETAAGWGIPMATDIAFALGVLSLLGNNVPTGLKIFLAALAIADDLFAILVIALFYSSDLHFDYLGYAGGVFVLQIILNRLDVKNILAYVLPGMVMWYFIHHSGIHATIAGVLTALTLPMSKTGNDSPLEKLEHLLDRPVNFLIMPLFALANTNITFESGMVNGLTGSLGLGILFGLCLGKPTGIFIMSYVSVKGKFAELPAGTNWWHILGLGVLGGIGFTMSIFIALLSFNDVGYQSQAKFAILTASVLSGIFGFMLLRFITGKPKA